MMIELTKYKIWLKTMETKLSATEHVCENLLQMLYKKFAKYPRIIGIAFLMFLVLGVVFLSFGEYKHHTLFVIDLIECFLALVSIAISATLLMYVRKGVEQAEAARKAEFEESLNNIKHVVFCIRRGDVGDILLITVNWENSRDCFKRLFNFDPKKQQSKFFDNLEWTRSPVFLNCNMCVPVGRFKIDSYDSSLCKPNECIISYRGYSSSVPCMFTK